MIAFKDDFFLIRFAVSGDEDPGVFQYAYRIHGLEDEWVSLGMKNSVILEDLKPGRHVFFVKASRDGETWLENQAELEIVIIPAFWQTPVFYALVVFAVLLSLFLFARFVRKRNRVRLEVDVDLSRRADKFHLTERETETLRCVLDGASNAEIGTRLFISESTVQKHIYSIYKKMNVKNRLQLLYVVQRAD
jgi:DNA-binding CsgD family transcriptional regulator